MNNILEFDDIKIGQIIEWTPEVYDRYGKLYLHAIIHILIDSKVDNGFNIQVLSGIDYDPRIYRFLLTPNNDYYHTSLITRKDFDKNKDFIKLADKNCIDSIKDRLSSHIKSYYDLYLNQKFWADQLMERVNEFFNTEENLNVN